MYAEIDDARSGWFPAINIYFARFSDVLFAAIIFGLAVFLLLYLITRMRILSGGIGDALQLIFYGTATHIATLGMESALMVYHTLLHIPISWYPTAALTVLPMAVDIPRWGSVLYLIAYCIASTWIVACGIKPHTVGKTPPPPAKRAAPTTQLFSGMRITIQS